MKKNGWQHDERMNEKLSSQGSIELNRRKIKKLISYLPTAPSGQDMTQGQISSGV